MVYQDYRIVCTVQRQGGGTLPIQLNHQAEGPYESRLEAYKCGVLEALRRAPPAGASGLYCQVYGMAPYPVNNWVLLRSEGVNL